MSRKFIIWLAAILLTGLLALKLEHCSYAQLQESLSMKGITKKISSKFPQINHITTSDLAARLNQADATNSTLLIDSRAPEEFKISHLADAKNLQTLDEVKSYLAGLPTPPESIVVYCSVGYRSADLATQIKAANITSSPIQNLLGSIFAWANEGRPLIKDENTSTTKVHPYDKKWGRLLKEEHRAILPSSKKK